MKYVMFVQENPELKLFVPIVFPSHMVHKDVAEAMIAGPLAGYTVHSAGEVSPLSMECFGKSTTLGVKSDGDADTLRIQMNDYGGAME